MVWPGAVGALTDEVIRRGYRKALIVTDKNLVQCGVVEKVTPEWMLQVWHGKSIQALFLIQPLR
jgi:alcohol dehydrogenase class IV